MQSSVRTCSTCRHSSGFSRKDENFAELAVIVPRTFYRHGIPRGKGAIPVTDRVRIDTLEATGEHARLPMVIRDVSGTREK